jgi:hypothetical protein
MREEEEIKPETSMMQCACSNLGPQLRISCCLISLLVRDPLQMEFSKRSTTNRKPIFSGNSKKYAIIPMGIQSTLGTQISTLTGFLKAFSRSQAGVLKAT